MAIMASPTFDKQELDRAAGPDLMRRVGFGLPRRGCYKSSNGSSNWARTGRLVHSRPAGEVPDDCE